MLRPYTQDDFTALIVKVALHDRGAFNNLYAATSAKLFGTCLRVLKNRSDAEEALQEVYVKICLKADRFALMGQCPMSWLTAIARHHAIDRLCLRRARPDDQRRPHGNQPRTAGRINHRPRSDWRRPPRHLPPGLASLQGDARMFFFARSETLSRRAPYLPV
ncbi:sigma factor [Ketogulonicigenium robustum]|uniref:sigma factor n=1 Tax=Ketogulonicigenium robustum TaxID=92947 RepID=UPI000A26D549|nr:sigma factor [Ketogulonicigenium robustum]